MGMPKMIQCNLLHSFALSIVRVYVLSWRSSEWTVKFPRQRQASVDTINPTGIEVPLSRVGRKLLQPKLPVCPLSLVVLELCCWQTFSALTWFTSPMTFFCCQSNSRPGFNAVPCMASHTGITLTISVEMRAGKPAAELKENGYRDSRWGFITPLSVIYPVSLFPPDFGAVFHIKISEAIFTGQLL